MGVREIKAALTALLAATGLISFTALGRNAPVYRDASAPVEQRVEDLLARMTLEEKIAQITAVWNGKQEIFTPTNDFDTAKARRVFPGGIGHVTRPSDLRGAGSNPFQQPFRDARQVVGVGFVRRQVVSQQRTAEHHQQNNPTDHPQWMTRKLAPALPSWEGLQR